MKKLNTIILALIISGCTSGLKTFKDHDDKTKRVKGIPYYIQKGVIRQTTQYLFKWKEISLVEYKNDKPSKSLITKRISTNSSTHAIENEVIKLSFLSSSVDTAQLISILNKINNINAYIFPEFDISSGNSKYESFIVSNTWKEDKIIDYKTKYYINSKLPWFGSATLTQKLSANGTLTELASTTDNQLDELVTGIAGIAGAVAGPISSVRIAQIEADSMVSSSPLEMFSQASSMVDIRYETSEKGLLYTFSKIYCSYPCNNVPEKAIPFDKVNGNFTVSNWPVKAKQTETKKEEKDKIEVSANIKLPKK